MGLKFEKNGAHENVHDVSIRKAASKHSFARHGLRQQGTELERNVAQHFHLVDGTHVRSVDRSFAFETADHCANNRCTQLESQFTIHSWQRTGVGVGVTADQRSAHE